MQTIMLEKLVPRSLTTRASLTAVFTEFSRLKMFALLTVDGSEIVITPLLILAFPEAATNESLPAEHAIY